MRIKLEGFTRSELSTFHYMLRLNLNLSGPYDDLSHSRSSPALTATADMPSMSLCNGGSSMSGNK